MNKERIVKTLIEDGVLPSYGVDGEPIDVSICEGLMGMYYLGRLTELGVIEGGDHQLTPEGFDTALSLEEMGWKMDAEMIEDFVSQLDVEDDGTRRGMVALILEMERLGYAEFKKQLEKVIESGTNEEE